MKHLFNIFGIISLGLVTLMSCKQESTIKLDCQWEGLEVFTKTYGADSTITIWPVITTNNYNFCDSMVYDAKTNEYIRPYEQEYKDGSRYDHLLCTFQQAVDSIQAGNDSACPCRINEDQNNDQINSSFLIGGITSFPNNVLNIRVLGDTVKIRHYENYGDKDNSDVFTGYVTSDKELGYYEYVTARVLASGIYEYELILYHDENYQQPIDTIRNKFAIITSRYKDANRNCGNLTAEPNDPLIAE